MSICCAACATCCMARATLSAAYSAFCASRARALCNRSGALAPRCRRSTLTTGTRTMERERLVESAPQERAPERREPILATGPATAPLKPGISGDERRKLRAALDELVACNRLLEAALAGPDSVEPSGPPA